MKNVLGHIYFSDEVIVVFCDAEEWHATVVLVQSDLWLQHHQDQLILSQHPQ